MSAFTQFYMDFAVGYEFGRKHPKLVNFILNSLKFLALLISVAFWAETCQGDLLITSGQSLGIRMISILYCLFVWGGMVGLIVLKQMKGMDLFKLYHWLMLILSVVVGALAIDTSSAGTIFLGAVMGFFLRQCPEFIYKLADETVNKIIQMKGKK